MAFAAMGCSGEDEKAEARAERVEFLTFWTEGGELQALDKLIEIHQDRRPNAEVIKTFEKNASYQERLTQRITEQNPPDTFQSNMGERLLKWVTESQVALEEVDGSGWNIPQELLDVNSREDADSGDKKLYGVPISLIRQSSFYYNRQLFMDHEIDMEALMLPGKPGVDALLDACAKLKAAGVEEPFGVGNIYDWTLDMMFWESLFPAVVGDQYYTKFWRGEADPENDPELDEALAYLLDLSQYFNADSADVDFPEVLERIANGEQAFGQQGDWGTGVLTGLDKGYAPGEQFDVMPFPGTSNMFIFSQDVLPIVAGTPNKAATQELLNTIATEELQVQFNLIKGSLPAVKDINIEATDLTATQKATYAQFNKDGMIKLPVVHGFKPDDVMKDLSAIEKTMIESQDTEELKNYIIANYGALQR
jgi:glucose/mannose transport system substrate-binding protein